MSGHLRVALETRAVRVHEARHALEAAHDVLFLLPGPCVWPADKYNSAVGNTAKLPGVL